MPANLWVYKCNRNTHHFKTGDTSTGDWSVDVFTHYNPVQWGGSWSTNNKASLNILHHRMMPNDLVLAYQTDDKLLVGLCKVFKITGEVGKKTLWLKPVQQFVPGVKIHILKKRFPALAKGKAFGRSFAQTLYEVTPEERTALESICGTQIDANADDPILTLRASRNGSGFGEAAQNKRVEKKAVQTVIRFYEHRNWTVVSVERNRCGYDLVCTKGSTTEYVEVKGISGPKLQFIITRNELGAAERFPQFVICAVTGTLTRQSKIHRLQGREIFDCLSFTPLQYTASPKYK